MERKLASIRKVREIKQIEGIQKITLKQYLENPIKKIETGIYVGTGMLLNIE